MEAALGVSGPGDIVLLSSGCINGAQIVKGKYIPHSDEAIIESFFLAKKLIFCSRKVAFFPRLVFNRRGSIYE